MKAGQYPAGLNQTKPKTMNLIQLTCLSLATTFGMACCKPEKTVEPDLNISVFVNFSLARGEDPDPFEKDLRARLSSVAYPIWWPELKSSMGIVRVYTEDDHLTELYREFEKSLKATGYQDRTSIGVDVRTSQPVPNP